MDLALHKLKISVLQTGQIYYEQNAANGQCQELNSLVKQASDIRYTPQEQNYLPVENIPQIYPEQHRYKVSILPNPPRHQAHLHKKTLHMQ